MGAGLQPCGGMGVAGGRTGAPAIAGHHSALLMSYWAYRFLNLLGQSADFLFGGRRISPDAVGIRELNPVGIQLHHLRSFSSIWTIFSNIMNLANFLGEIKNYTIRI
jgi:hypothetical protein